MARKKVKIELTGKHAILRMAVDGWRIHHVDGKATVLMESGTHELQWQARTVEGAKYSVKVTQGSKTLAERKDLEATDPDDIGRLEFAVKP